MPAIVVVGAQWGDEGKGKATDLLGDRVDYVVRYQGGNNAGHTVVIGDESYALHLLPSGVLSPNVVPVIGNGVVIDPQVLLDEIDGLAARGVDCAKLLVSANAHLITPYHRALDKVTERYLGSARIGTTGRGIGPAYGDKIARTGIRVQDLFDPGILRQKLDLVLREKNQILTKVYNRRGIEAEAIAADYERYAERLRPYVADTGPGPGPGAGPGQGGAARGRPGHHARRGPRHLPVRHLVLPHRGRGLRRGRHRPDPDLRRHRDRQGVHDPGRRGALPHRAPRRHRRMAAQGGRRVRRDHRPAAPLRLVRRGHRQVRDPGERDHRLLPDQAGRLSGLEQVPVCVGYEVDGKRYDEIPMTQTEFHHAVPVYEYFDGWWEDISKASSLDDLPANARAYISAVEEMIGAPVCAVGVGPRRDQTLQIRDLLR